MSVPPEVMTQGGPEVGNPVTSAAEIRDSLPDVDTSIDPTQFASGGVTNATVERLDPPTDIDAATIDDYTSYNAQQGVVAPEATVESRMDSLLSKNSDYMQRATSRADQLANRRGMLNSSMAIGSAHGAAIDAALPIAQQDAATQLQMDLTNLGYSNEEARSLAEQSVTRSNLKAGLEQDTNQFNAAQNFEADVRNQDAANAANTAAAAEANRNNFAILSADLQGQLAGIDNELALNMEELQSTYDILQNLDTVNGSIYQQLTAEIGTILANSDDPREAQGKINMLIASAGAELAFSTGSTGGTGGCTAPAGPVQTAVPVKPPKTTTTKGGGEGGASDGPGGDAGNASSGGSDGPGDGPGGDGSGCFSGDTCFLMSDGSYKPISEIQKGDVTVGGVVTNTRSGPSDRDWYDYKGSKVTDEHFVFEDGVWMYVKNAKQAQLIEPIDTYYTMDTTDHTLHGINGALFSDDAVFDADDPIHDLPYGKAAWDLMLNRLNSEEWAA